MNEELMECIKREIIIEENINMYFFYRTLQNHNKVHDTYDIYYTYDFKTLFIFPY